MKKRSTKRPAELEQYGVALPDGLYIETFSYPMSTTKLDKAWEKSPGIRLAQCIKAILGKQPFRWNGPESAERMAEEVGGSAVALEYDAMWEADRVVIYSRETESDENDKPRKAPKSKAGEQPVLFGDGK